MGGAILWYEPIQLTLHDAETAQTADGKVMELGGRFATVAVQVTGTMTNSDVHFEGSIDGENWESLGGIDVTDGSATADTGDNTGLWKVPVEGIVFMRARRSGTGSGEITVAAVATAAPLTQIDEIV